MMIRNSLIVLTTIFCKVLYPIDSPARPQPQEPLVELARDPHPKLNSSVVTTVFTQWETEFVTMTPIAQPVVTTTTTTTTAIPTQHSSFDMTDEDTPICEIYTMWDLPLWSYLSYAFTILGFVQQIAKYRQTKKLEKQLRMEEQRTKTLEEELADLESVYQAVVDEEKSKSLECAEAWRAQAQANSRADRAEVEVLHARERAAIFAERHTQMMELTERHQQEIRHLEFKIQQLQAYCENVLLKLPSVLFLDLGLKTGSEPLMEQIPQTISGQLTQH